MNLVLAVEKVGDTPNGDYFVISGSESTSNFEGGMSKSEGTRTLLRHSVFDI